MDSYLEKAKNYFILGKIAEIMGMHSEAASNYFKSLSAVNDFLLETLNLKAKDHSDRFRLLEQNFPDSYEITDKMFVVYRRTYTAEISKEELAILRKNLENAFKNAKIQIPTDEEIRRKAKEISKK